jgi:uncharacterized membrane protein
VPEVKLAAPLLLGVATGIRSSMALAGLGLRPPPPSGIQRLKGVFYGTSAWTGGHKLVAASGVVAVAGELVADKLPTTPSRLELPGLLTRLGIGALVGAGSARRWHADPVQVAVSAAIGVVGAAAGSFAGARWRSWAGTKFGSDLPGALIEDATGLAVTAAAMAVHG